jgi:hypothetical protein
MVAGLRKPTLEELTEFTLDSYTTLLQYLREIYTITPFCSASKTNVPSLILRHDIDYSIENALRMARIERNLEIKSTYFVLIKCEFYDAFEDKNVADLKEISKLGHEIGLHFEPHQYRFYNQSMKKTFKAEISQLEALLDEKVRSISRHGPWDRDAFASIKGYINANHPFWRSDLFIHESCRAWTPFEGLPILLNSPPRRVQLLIHPDNWQENKVDRMVLFEKLFRLSKYGNSDFKERTKEFWLNDPLVIKYEHALKNLELNRYNEELLANAKSKGYSMNRLNYYKKLIGWHIINSVPGWTIHQAFDKIREDLERKPTEKSKEMVF